MVKNDKQCWNNARNAEILSKRAGAMLKNLRNDAETYASNGESAKMLKSA